MFTSMVYLLWYYYCYFNYYCTATATAATTIPLSCYGSSVSGTLYTAVATAVLIPIYCEQEQTFQPQFGYIGSNRRKARWPLHAKGQLLILRLKTVAVYDSFIYTNYIITTTSMRLKHTHDHVLQLLLRLRYNYSMHECCHLKCSSISFYQLSPRPTAIIHGRNGNH